MSSIETPKKYRMSGIKREMVDPRQTIKQNAVRLKCSCDTIAFMAYRNNMHLPTNIEWLAANADWSKPDKDLAVEHAEYVKSIREARRLHAEMKGGAA
jgi:hypothetical protein